MKDDSQNRSLEAALARLNNSVEVLVDITAKNADTSAKKDTSIVDALQKMVKQGDDAKVLAKEQRADKSGKSKTLDALKQMSLTGKKGGAGKFNITKFIQHLGKAASKALPKLMANFAKFLGPIGIAVAAIIKIGSVVSGLGDKVGKAISAGLNAIGGIVNGAFDAISNGLNALHSMLPQSLQKVLGPAFKVLTFAIAGIKKAFNVAFSVIKSAWKAFSESLIGKLALGLLSIYLLYKFLTSDAITNWLGEKLTVFYNNLQSDDGIFGKIFHKSETIKEFISTVADSIGTLIVWLQNSGGLGELIKNAIFGAEEMKAAKMQSKFATQDQKTARSIVHADAAKLMGPGAEQMLKALAEQAASTDEKDAMQTLIAKATLMPLDRLASLYEQGKLSEKEYANEMKKAIGSTEKTLAILQSGDVRKSGFIDQLEELADSSSLAAAQKDSEDIKRLQDYKWDNIFGDNERNKLILSAFSKMAKNQNIGAYTANKDALASDYSTSYTDFAKLEKR